MSCPKQICVGNPVQAALANWRALSSFSSIVMPGESTGSNSWEGFFSAGLQINQVISEHIQGLPDDDGIAGFNQGRLNDQVLFADNNNLILESAPNQLARSPDRITLINVSADEFSVDGHASSSSDSHAAQSEIDSFLRRTEGSAITDVACNPESWEAKNGTMIDNGGISISDLDVGSQPSTSSSDRTSSESEIIKPQAVTLGGLTHQLSLVGEGGNLVGSDILATLATPDRARARIRIIRVRFNIVSALVA
jgi:hypothetical protein